MQYTPRYKIDYLRLKFTIDADLFDGIYTRLKLLMLKKWGGSVEDMERCHKVNVFRNYHTKANYYMVDIWDIGSEIMYDIAEQYGHTFQRVDIRHIDDKCTKDDILALGHQLQTDVTSWNVNVYNTKAATKRLGRDRGGIGFAIGSHKSDLRITKYIRGREAGALEYQVQGKQLKKALEMAREEYAATPGALGIGSLLADNLDAMGHHRYSAAISQAHKAIDGRTAAARADNLRRVSQSPLWESDDNRNVAQGDPSPTSVQDKAEGENVGLPA